MDTRKISYTKQLADEAVRKQRLDGLFDGYFSGIMDLPMRAFEYMLPDTGHTPGELRSSPKDKVKGDRLAWKTHREERMKNPDYARGDFLSYGPQIAADPFFDVPLALVPRMAKAYQAARGLGQFGERMVPEAGAIVLKDGKPLPVYHGTTKAFDEFDPAQRTGATGALDAGHGVFFGTRPDTANSYSGLGLTPGGPEEWSISLSGVFDNWLKTNPKIVALDTKIEALRDRVTSFNSPMAKELQQLQTQRQQLWGNLWYEFSKNPEHNPDFLAYVGQNLPNSSVGANVRRHYLDVNNMREVSGVRRYREGLVNSILEKARSDGYDSLVFRGMDDNTGPDDIYVAFDEKQIIPAWEYDYKNTLGSFGKKK